MEILIHLFPPEGRGLIPETKKFCISDDRPADRTSKNSTSVLVFLKKNCVFDSDCKFSRFIQGGRSGGGENKN